MPILTEHEWREEFQLALFASETQLHLFDEREALFNVNGTYTRTAHRFSEL